MIKKEIAEKLFKAELSQERVDLAAIDDLENIFKEAYSLSKKSSILNQVQSSLDKAYEKYQLVRRTADSYIRSAKDLGADDLVKKLEKIQSEADSQMRMILKAIAKIEEAVKLLS